MKPGTYNVKIVMNDDGVTWGFVKEEDDSPSFPSRPYRCLSHKVVDFGTKRGYCKVCDVDLFMDENGYFKERERAP